MWIGVGLCVLGLLGLHSSVFGQEAVRVQPGVLIFCDDPSVEKAVSSAVHKFNERLSTGHKLALYQIVTASKSENGSDSVYSLQFTTRRSDCPAGSSNHWTECSYLPHGHKKPSSCNATVHMTDADAHTKQVDCVLEDHIVQEKATCLGCPEDIDENSEDLKVPLSASISKYNSMSDSTHLYSLHSVAHATRQVVAGFRFKIRFDMRRTTCAKAEHKDLNDRCAHDDQNIEFSNCNATVDVAPWRYEHPQAQNECESGPLPPAVFKRRRPPGWTPLRSFISQELTAVPTKEESSEEDTTASKPSASPDVAAGAGSSSPFNCPSKPWKDFKPATPTMAASDGATQQPTVGTFSDIDLLG